MNNNPYLSFVIPARDEEKSIEILYKEIVNEIQLLSKPYEIIFVDDGSEDNTSQKILKLKQKDSNIILIKLRGHFGKSIALQCGFEKTRGQIIITLDADLQDNPKEISRFINEINKGFDLVSGWKKMRHDPLSKTIPSKIGNWLTRMTTGIKIHDLNCGFKAYRREVIMNLNLYGELYKYIPVLAAKQNFKVGEIVIEHRPRKYGKSKYGIERNLKGFLDMLTVIFLTSYLKKPAHFFGTIGIIFFSIGFIIGLYITYLRVTTGGIQYRQPLLMLGILDIVVGIQLITTGLLAEMITNVNQTKTNSQNYIQETK